MALRKAPAAKRDAWSLSFETHMEKTDFQNLVSDLHMCTMPPPHMIKEQIVII